MSSTISNIVDSEVMTNNSGARKTIGYNSVALAFLVLLEALVIIWTKFDHSLPCWDTAAHRLNSCALYELLCQPHWNHLRWYQEAYSVSPLYPPFFYFVSACGKLAFGEWAETELLANLLFSAVLYASVYYIAIKTFQNRVTAITAAVLIFCYPLVFWLTHSVVLDCAASAMVAFSLALLFWWTEKPAILRSIILGTALGLTVLTKNNTPAYLAGPIVLDAILALRNRDRIRLAQLILVGIVSGLVILPWAIFAGPAVRDYVTSIQSQNLGLHDHNSFFNEFFDILRVSTFEDLPEILTPLFYGCFFLALVSNRAFGRKKLYILASILGGLILCSGFRWLHSVRYVIPLAVPIAVLTANMFTSAWSSQRILLRCGTLIVATLALFQFIYSAFTPYPIRFPSWLNKSLVALGARNTFSVDGWGNLQGLSLHPLSNQDWGTAWALSILEKESKSQNGTPVTLIVMPNSPDVTLSIYIYLAKVRKDSVRAVDSRQYAVTGDRVTFVPEQAESIDWYVTKTGDQGRSFVDRSSLAAYEKWCQFVASSKNFALKGKKLLPDGSVLRLYQRIGNPKPGQHS